MKTASTATTYELTYFDAPGRAEHIRPMLHAAGLNFTDNRFPFEEWAKIQPQTPLGVVPTMKIDGKTYCQSNVSALVGTNRYEGHHLIIQCLLLLFLFDISRHFFALLRLGSRKIRCQVGWFLSHRSARSVGSR